MIESISLLNNYTQMPQHDPGSSLFHELPSFIIESTKFQDLVRDHKVKEAMHLDKVSSWSHVKIDIEKLPEDKFTELKDLHDELLN